MPAATPDPTAPDAEALLADFIDPALTLADRLRRHAGDLDDLLAFFADPAIRARLEGLAELTRARLDLLATCLAPPALAALARELTATDNPEHHRRAASAILLAARRTRAPRPERAARPDGSRDPTHEGGAGVPPTAPALRTDDHPPRPTAAAPLEPRTSSPAPAEVRDHPGPAPADAPDTPEARDAADSAQARRHAPAAEPIAPIRPTHPSTLLAAAGAPTSRARDAPAPPEARGDTL